ncbi:MAG: IS481 family transposase [Candidatus Brocadiia bacterium]|nr:MAG: IS481 family transposase [Candidatus Brocadiia bacterium]
MPWTETCVMEQKVKFIMDLFDGNYTMAELCRYYNISRKTGYKWLGRYQQDGAKALSDLSRAPHNHPNAISPQIQQAILSIKEEFPRWGAPKIRNRLERIYPSWDSYPAISTIGLFLHKHGLTVHRKRRRRASPTESPLTKGIQSNDVWCADFKGHFRTGDGNRCNPLTISDHSSRYLLCCRHIRRMSYELVKMRFERVFAEYGLPRVIRTDNGTPFASRGLGGLSRLSYWWIRLGIHPERIEPGHPEQNGRHERIHKTLKDHTARPAAKTIVRQQKRFDEFCIEYNEHRPHEALDMRTPAECYVGSKRDFPSRLPQVTYPEDMLVRRVHNHGDILYFGRRLFLAESLKGEDVGIEQISEDMSRLWYCDYLLGEIDHRKWQIAPAKSRSLICAYAQISGYKPEKVLPMSSV